NMAKEYAGYKQRKRIKKLYLMRAGAVGTKYCQTRQTHSSGTRSTLKLIHPHGRCAAYSNGHDEEVQNRDRSEYRNHRTKGVGFGLILFQSVSHVVERHLVIIKRIVTILNGKYPSREDKPQHGAERLPECRDQQQDK